MASTCASLYININVIQEESNEVYWIYKKFPNKIKSYNRHERYIIVSQYVSSE